MLDLEEYLPQRVNSGAFLTAYTLEQLKLRAPTDRMVLPICSFGTPVEDLTRLAPLVLPPLYHEALGDGLKSKILAQVEKCFPFFEGTRHRDEIRGQFEIVEISPTSRAAPIERPEIFAFSVDTAVEEHGPHLPLMTDTIQSYGVLQRLADENDSIVIGPPVEYGQLTWGLPFGMSIDITPPLLTQYVRQYVDALYEWIAPVALYVVDVHGSIIHRNAIQDGLRQSRSDRWDFRWLHEPLVEFAGDRGDQHAGGVETSLVHLINPDLLDSDWWPDRIDAIAAGQMSMTEAIELSADLSKFVDRVDSGDFNGIVGDVRNFHHVDGEVMMQRILDVARKDIASLKT